MTASFQCPHCDATYPLLPTLYGRTVRCSSCKKPFRLRGDGIAEAVDGTKRETKRKARTDEEKEQLTKAFISQSHENKAKKPPTKRLQKKQEQKKNLKELKASMSSALSAAATEAIAVEERKQNDPGTRTNPTAALEPRKGKKSQPQATISSGPILTNQGQREWKGRLSVGLFFLLILGGIGSCIMLISPKSELQLALEAYSAATEHYNNGKKRLMTYRERNWLFTYDGDQGPSVIVNVNKAQAGEPQEYELTILSNTIQDSINGLVDYPKYAMWAPASAQKKIDDLYNKHKNAAAPIIFHKALEKNNIRFTSYQDMGDALIEKANDPYLAFMLSALLAGTTDAKGTKKWSEKLISGDILHHCQIADFSGSDGQALSALGNRSNFKTIARFEGKLVKLIGERWTPEWRIFTTHDHSRELNNPLITLYRAFQFKWMERHQRNNPNRPPPEAEPEPDFFE